MRGWSAVSTTDSNVEDSVAPEPDSLRSTLSALATAASISFVSVAVRPRSAMDSMPGVAVPPASRNATAALWTPPINGEKCAPSGMPPGVAAAVQLPIYVMV